MKCLDLVLSVNAEIKDSNLPAFRASITEGIATINRHLTTDEEFGQAEQDVKVLTLLQGKIVTAKEHAIEQAESLNAALNELDEAAAEVGQVRLGLKKLIDTRKAELKTQIVSEYVNHFGEQGDITNARAECIRPALIEVVKGKRTMQTMRGACDTLIADRITAITQCREIIRAWVEREDGLAILVPDEADLELKHTEYVEAELERRLERRKLQEEAEKAKRALAEQKAKEKTEKKQLEAQAKPATATQENRLSAIAEMDAFKVFFVEAMSPIKTAREILVDRENKAKALAFSKAINLEFQKL
jgi:hypothetical protein